MDSLFGGSAIRTLRKMLKKDLIKVEDLDTPPSGWFTTMGYERENKTGKWKRILRTECGATPSIPLHKLPKYKNVLTGKITFDPVEYEKQY
tara:strand:- start:2019 stop:2291 length:273 start_codon:yes stop_codon:yes gene_type:complete